MTVLYMLSWWVLGSGVKKGASCEMQATLAVGAQKECIHVSCS